MHQVNFHPVHVHGGHDESNGESKQEDCDDEKSKELPTTKQSGVKRKRSGSGSVVAAKRHKTNAIFNHFNKTS